MYGEVFQGLKKLKTVHLERNSCIDEYFTTSERIAVLRQTLNEECSIETNDKRVEASMAQSSTKEKIMKLEVELIVANTHIARLETEITTLKSKMNEQSTSCIADIENLKKQTKAPFFKIIIANVAIFLIILVCLYIYKNKLSKMFYRTQNDCQMSAYDQQQLADQ